MRPCRILLRHFYPRPPRGGRPLPAGVPASVRHFYPRPPRGGRPVSALIGGNFPRISIHALREEGDLIGVKSSPACMEFLSTPSARRATRQLPPQIPAKRISIHALREEGDLYKVHKNPRLEKFLSTPSARRATSETQNQNAGGPHFYPRPPRGGRLGYPVISICRTEFLSTPSARRATIYGYNIISPDKFLSTPSARRATAARPLPCSFP